MCTAVFIKDKKPLFGRNLDLEYHYSESVAVVPRNFPIKFKTLGEIKNHYAIMGTAFIEDGYPLFYDAVNEYGLCAAGLNFPKTAFYNCETESKFAPASFELIPWILCSCKNLSEAFEKLSKCTITDLSFSKKLKSTPLHWIFTDKNRSIVVEQSKNKLNIFENPVGVLTNEPSFDFQMINLQNYLNLSPYEPKNMGNEENSLYSRGLGAFGIPGDMSSMSRFVKAVFVKQNYILDENCEIMGFFHILETVTQPKGCVRLENNALPETVYSSCIDIENKIYYYRTSKNSRICAVDMNRENLDGNMVSSYPMSFREDIFYQNRV